MNRKTTGFLVASAAVLTSVVVVLRAEKPRRFLQARFKQVRGALPGPKQAQQSAKQLATRVSHLASDVKGTSKQTMSKVKHAGSDLADKAKQRIAVGSKDEH